MRSPVAEPLADPSRGFAAAAIRWYRIGAHAAIVYGVARLTADVDVTARATAGTATATWLAPLSAVASRGRCARPNPTIGAIQTLEEADGAIALVLELAGGRRCAPTIGEPAAFERAPWQRRS